MSNNSEASDATVPKMMDISFKGYCSEDREANREFIKSLLKNVFLVLYKSLMGSSTCSCMYGTVLSQFTNT